MDPHYIAMRRREYGERTLLMRIIYRAIADALSSPPKLKKNFPDYKRRGYIERWDRPRRDAVRWLFSEEEDEPNFGYICRRLGIDAQEARFKIVMLSLLETKLKRPGQLRRLLESCG